MRKISSKLLWSLFTRSRAVISGTGIIFGVSRICKRVGYDKEEVKSLPHPGLCSFLVVFFFPFVPPFSFLLSLLLPFFPFSHSYWKSIEEGQKGILRIPINQHTSMSFYFLCVILCILECYKKFVEYVIK